MHQILPVLCHRSSTGSFIICGNFLGARRKKKKRTSFLLRPLFSTANAFLKGDQHNLTGRKLMHACFCLGSMSGLIFFAPLLNDLALMLVLIYAIKEASARPCQLRAKSSWETNMIFLDSRAIHRESYLVMFIKSNCYPSYMNEIRVLAGKSYNFLF